MRSWDRLNLLIVLLILLLDAIGRLELLEMLAPLDLLEVPLLTVGLRMALLVIDGPLLALLDALVLRAPWKFLLTWGLLGLALTELAIVKLFGLRWLP